MLRCADSYRGARRKRCSGLRERDEVSEPFGVVHSNVGKHLSIDLDVVLLQARHEPRVAHVVSASGGVDAYDPQPSVVSLVMLTIAVGVAETLLHCGHGRFDDR